MASDEPLLFVPVGTNEARPFGMDAREWACRLAGKAGLQCADAPAPGRSVLLASMRYAWDPAWLRVMQERPGAMLTLAGKPVIANVPAGSDPAAAAAGLEYQRPVDDYELVPSETAELSGVPGRNRERPFVTPLEAAEPVERAVFDAGWTGGGNLLSHSLLRTPAFHLTRAAARAQFSPDLVMTVGAILCAVTFALFWRGQYWGGVLSGFAYMLLRTIGAKLAQVTGVTPEWSDAFDRGIDLIYPPFWYWAWMHGLAAYGRPMEPVLATMVLWAIIGGYVAQRIIQGIFIKRFRIPIQAWRPIDSKFRSLTAGPRPNLVILTGTLVFSAPDIGLELAAGWTIATAIFHAVRLAQATERALRRDRITSWLDE